MIVPALHIERLVWRPEPHSDAPQPVCRVSPASVLFWRPGREIRKGLPEHASGAGSPTRSGRRPSCGFPSTPDLLGMGEALSDDYLF
jgi:hypothetical protein